MRCNDSQHLRPTFGLLNTFKHPPLSRWLWWLISLFSFLGGILLILRASSYGWLLSCDELLSVLLNFIHLFLREIMFLRVNACVRECVFLFEVCVFTFLTRLHRIKRSHIHLSALTQGHSKTQYTFKNAYYIRKFRSIYPYCYNVTKRTNVTILFSYYILSFNKHIWMSLQLL